MARFLWVLALNQRLFPNYIPTATPIIDSAASIPALAMQPRRDGVLACPSVPQLFADLEPVGLFFCQQPHRRTAWRYTKIRWPRLNRRVCYEYVYHVPVCSPLSRFVRDHKFEFFQR
jgi:hypothetical protein